MARSFFGGLVNGQVRFDVIPGTGYLAGTDFPLTPCPTRANYAPGTAADQLDGVSYVLMTLLASTPQTIDLTALVDVFGVAITAARVRFLASKNLTGTDGIYTLIGNNGSNDWLGMLSATGTARLWTSSPLNDGLLLWNAPNTTAGVVDATHKIIKYDPGTTAQTVLAIIGTASA